MLVESRTWWFAVCVIGAWLSSQSARAQITYQAMQDVTRFGWLDQYSLAGPPYNNVGPEACVPTSSVNVMTYLQNSAPGVFGTALTGSSYDDWVATDVVLVGPNYLNTSPSEGTAYNRIPYGLSNYIMQYRGFDGVHISGMIPEVVWTAQTPPEQRPAAIQDAFPTWEFLYQAIISQSGTVLGLTYPDKQGHAVALGGFSWTDVNGNDVIDPGEALLAFVDPLDPTRGTDPIGGAVYTTGQVWMTTVPDPVTSVPYDVLQVQYDQYTGSDLWGGALGGSTSYGTATLYITTAVTVAVPEPQALMLAGAGMLALLVLRTRGSADGGHARAGHRLRQHLPAGWARARG